MRRSRVGFTLCAGMAALACATSSPYQRGVQYDEAGQHERAVEEFTEAIALDPGHPAPRHGRALAYINLGQYENATADLDEAIRLDPDYPLAYFTRGTLYAAHLGDPARGVQDFDKCIELEPEFPLAYQSRGVALRAMGRPEEGCRDWQRACQLGYRQGCASVSQLCPTAP